MPIIELSNYTIPTVHLCRAYLDLFGAPKSQPEDGVLRFRL